MRVCKHGCLKYFCNSLYLAVLLKESLHEKSHSFINIYKPNGGELVFIFGIFGFASWNLCFIFHGISLVFSIYFLRTTILV